MKKLEHQFKRKGYNYNLVIRNNNYAIYSQSNDHVTCYEVFKVLSHNGREIAGNYVPPSEFMPSDEQWGTYGWTFGTMENALGKWHELSRKVVENG